MHYTSIAPSGMPLQVVQSSAPTLHAQVKHPDAQLVIEQEPPSEASYWDYATETWLEKPSQPSLHHIFNWATKQWQDPRTLADLKAAQWNVIKQARSQAEYAGFTWDGSTFDSDAISQNRITGAVTLATLNAAFSIGWTLADNTVRTLNAQGMCAVGAALGTHVATQFAKAQGLRTQIEAAADPAALALIVW